MQVMEEYWGSADSYRQWGVRNVRRISKDGFAVSSSKDKETHRMKSDPNLVSRRATSPQGSDGDDNDSGLTRDRRSKSSALMYKKNQNHSANSTPGGRPMKDNEEIGRSPLAWIQRFEEWHKDMKTQKEKKKAEKKRFRLYQRSESMCGPRNGQSDSGSGNTWLRDAIDSSPPLLRAPSKKSQGLGVDGFSLGHRRRSTEHQRSPDNVPMLEEPPLSRSFSDPFRSPAGIAGHQRHTTIEKSRSEVDRGPMIPQHPFKRDYDAPPQKSDFDDARKRTRSGSVRGSRGFSDQSTLSRSTNSYANTASFTQDHQDDTCSNHSSDDKGTKQSADELSPPPLHLDRPVAHDPLYSPVHVRSNSVDFIVDEPSSRVPRQAHSRSNSVDYVVDKPARPPVHCRSSSVDFAVDESSACAVPTIRRIVSVPIEDQFAQRLRNKERANVLQYMHRKASDASSIAGSIPRSPARMSESSSDSSRFGDHASNRSGKYRKSSFRSSTSCRATWRAVWWTRRSSRPKASAEAPCPQLQLVGQAPSMSSGPWADQSPSRRKVMR